MKNIGSFKPEKYQSAKTKGVFKKPLYTELEDGIYEVHGKEKLYVTSLSFEQEPGRKNPYLPMIDKILILG